jgi:RNA polymerase sigma-70 factor (ECF subfamily)
VIASWSQPDDAGESSDFAQFYRAHAQQLTIQLYAYTGDMGQAQDLVHEAFCRALARWSRINRYDEPVLWVRRVAWNLATSGFRRRRIAAAFLSRQRPEHVPGPVPDRIALRTALAGLPGPQRRAVILHYLVDLPVAEIARQEGVAEGTVKSWLHRGRTALADALRETGMEEAHA